MTKSINFIISSLILWAFSSFAAEQVSPKIKVPASYATIKEQLVCFQNDNLKVYYGGPVSHAKNQIKWTMLAEFEKSEKSTPSNYEISFIHCTPDTAHNAEVFYIEAADIDIKFRNTLNDTYQIFSDLIAGRDHQGPYILIRRSDVSMTTYPTIFIDSFHNETPEVQTSNLELILQFLTSQCAVRNTIKKVLTVQKRQKLAVQSECREYIEFVPVLVKTQLESGEEVAYYITPYFIKGDSWGIYYAISSRKTIETQQPVLVRIDSGCMSGQIYDDDSCDCADQFNAFLKVMAENPNSLLIHIPGHDGRGFGSAPKAETEIYKRGGTGRIYSTEALNTVEAAHFLYRDPDGVYDLRTYEGAAFILKLMGFTTLDLYTDNRRKIAALKDADLSVNRVSTGTNKTSCNHHIEAKHGDPQYFGHSAQ